MATITNIHPDVFLEANWNAETQDRDEMGEPLVIITPHTEQVSDGFVLEPMKEGLVQDGKYVLVCESSNVLHNEVAYMVDTQGVFLDVFLGYGSRRNDIWTYDEKNDVFHNTGTFGCGNILDTQALNAAMEHERRYGWTIIFETGDVKQKFRGILIKGEQMAVNDQGGFDSRLNANLTCSRKQFGAGGKAPFGFKDTIKVAGETWSVEGILIRPSSITFQLAEFS